MTISVTVVVVVVVVVLLFGICAKKFAPAAPLIYCTYTSFVLLSYYVPVAVLHLRVS